MECGQSLLLSIQLLQMSSSTPCGNLTCQRKSSSCFMIFPGWPSISRILPAFLHDLPMSCPMIFLSNLGHQSHATPNPQPQGPSHEGSPGPVSRPGGATYLIHWTMVTSLDSRIPSMFYLVLFCLGFTVAKCWISEKHVELCCCILLNMFMTCQFCCENIHHNGRLCIPHFGLSNPYLLLIESPFLLVKPLMFLASAPVSVEARPIFIGQTMSNGQFSPNPLPAV